MTKTVFRMLFAASALAGAAQVQAQPPILVEGQPTILVPYGDLDLSRSAGQEALMGRVQRAADRLCAAEIRGLGPAMEARRCRGAVLATAHLQVDRAIASYGTTQFAGRASLTVAGR